MRREDFLLKSIIAMVTISLIIHELKSIFVFVRLKYLKAFVAITKFMHFNTQNYFVRNYVLVILTHSYTNDLLRFECSGQSYLLGSLI